MHIHNLLIRITVRLRRPIMNDPIVLAYCPVSLLLNMECDVGLIQGRGVRRGHGRILICGIRRGHGRILICDHHTHTNLHRWGHHAVHHPGLHFGHRRGNHAVHHAGLHYVHHVPVIERLLLKGCMLRLSIKMSS